MKLGLLTVFLFSLGHQPIERAEATLLCNFTKHIEWQSEPVRIGVMGNSRVLTELSNLIKRKKLSIELGKIDYISEALNYDMVFIPKDQGVNVPPLVEKIGSSPILLVAENTDVGKEGVEICFIQEEGKLRFVINNTIAKSKGITIKNSLLDYATDIY